MSYNSYIADNVNSIEPSGIRKIHENAKNYSDTINLSLGQPDFIVDEKIKIEAIRSIITNKNKYLSTYGLDELREQICKQIQTKKEIFVDEKQIIITSGASGALFLVLASIINSGDEIIVSDPCYNEYLVLPKLFGGIVKPVDTYPDFRFTAEKIEKEINNKTKALIINSPSNPTGVVLTKTELIAIAELCKKHNILIISDDTYDFFNYTEENFNIGSVYENSVIIGSFSKTYALMGWRLGYLVGPREIIEAAFKIQQYTFLCAPSISQYAVLNAKENFNVFLSYKKKLEIVKNNLIGVSCIKPQGAFYFFPKINFGTATQYCEELFEKFHVCVVPGKVFSNKDCCFRLSYAIDDNLLIEGCKRITQFNKYYNNGGIK